MTTDFFSLNAILPDELQTRLDQLGYEISQREWQIGDIANEVYEAIKQSDKPVARLLSKEDICAAIGKRVQKSASTVKLYARVAEFFPQSVRDEFDTLYFSTFVFACRRQFQENEAWRRVLEYAVRQQCSVDLLEATFLETPETAEVPTSPNGKVETLDKSKFQLPRITILQFSTPRELLSGLRRISMQFIPQEKQPEWYTLLENIANFFDNIDKSITD